MELHSLELREFAGQVRIQCQASWRGGGDTLWYEVDQRHAGHLTTDRFDGFAVGLLLKAMALGEDLEIRGTLSERLHFNLSHYYMSIVSEVLPSLQPVRILADRLDDGASRPRPAGVGTGFSAGIDSFAVINAHLLDESRPGYRLTHLLFNNVGSHGDRDFAAARHLFHQRHEAVRGYPQSIGLDLIKVDSNLSDLLQMNFVRSHTPRNFSVALLFQQLFGRYYYASTFRYRDCFVGETYDMAFTDPVAVHLLSTETLDCVATGSELSRVEKTRSVTRVPNASRWLNVCASAASDGRNCSKCGKCCRTLLTLEMLGAIEPFAGAFDLQAWRQARNGYISLELLNRRRETPFSREILEFADSIGYRFTPWQRAATALNVLPRPLLRLGRSIRRRYPGGA